MPDPIPRGAAMAAAHRPLSGAEADELLSRASRLLQEHNVKVLNAVDEGIYVLDGQGNTIFANDAAARMLGYSIREMLGLSQHALVHHSYVDGTPVPIEECPIYQTVTDGVFQRVGGDTFWRKDGTPLPVDFTSSPIRAGRALLGAVISFRDVSEHQQVQEQARRLASERAAREEARRARQLLERVFEQAPSAITMTEGPEHRIVVANALARELAGRDLAGHTVREAFPAPRVEGLCDVLDRVYASGETQTTPAVDLRRQPDPAHAGERFDITYRAVRDEERRVVGVVMHAVPGGGEGARLAGVVAPVAGDRGSGMGDGELRECKRSGAAPDGGCPACV